MNHASYLRRRSLLLGCTVVALALVTTACSGETTSVDSGSGGADTKTLKIAMTAGYDEGNAATYLWKEILEEKGYKVEVQDLDIASSFTGVANKQFDLYLDAWLPATHEPYWKRYGSKLDIASTWYEPADLNLSVPTYVKDVNTIEDLKAHASEFDGQIIGIEAGSGLMRLTRTSVMPAYGLTDDYKLTESSTSAMLSELKTSIAEKKPVLVTLWRPHWAYTKFPLKALKDTKGAYGKPDKIQAIAPKGFAADNPDLAKWLKNFKLTSDQLGNLELLLQKKGEGNEQAAAKEWIAQNKTVVDGWLA